MIGIWIFTKKARSCRTKIKKRNIQEKSVVLGSNVMGRSRWRTAQGWRSVRFSGEQKKT